MGMDGRIFLMSYSLNYLKGDLVGSIVAVIKGDTRSLNPKPDNRSY